MPTQDHIAIFVSGTGSNAKRIIEHFRNNSDIQVDLLIANKPDAPALAMAREAGVKTLVIDKAAFSKGNELLNTLQEHRITFLVLAGFLWLIPAWLIEAFPDSIINIHPSLLPKFGGKGMFGHHVHEAVIQAGETQSGISIHFVNEAYDEGGLLFQASCPVFPEDSARDPAQRIQALEHKYYPLVIEEFLKNRGR